MTITYTNLITSEHQDKPNFMAMVAASFQPFVDLISLYAQQPTLYDLDIAVGAQLDVIGEWVGVSRTLQEEITGVYFSFDTPGLGFDQGVWEGPGSPATGLVSLSDDYYRVLIRVKILNNQWDGSLANANELANELFNAFGYTFQINDPCNLTISLQLSGPPNPPSLLIALLEGGYFDIRPAGITITSYIHP